MAVMFEVGDVVEVIEEENPLQGTRGIITAVCKHKDKCVVFFLGHDPLTLWADSLKLVVPKGRKSKPQPDFDMTKTQWQDYDVGGDTEVRQYLLYCPECRHISIRLCLHPEPIEYDECLSCGCAELEALGYFLSDPKPLI